MDATVDHTQIIDSLFILLRQYSIIILRQYVFMPSLVIAIGIHLTVSPSVAISNSIKSNVKMMGRRNG